MVRLKRFGGFHVIASSASFDQRVAVRSRSSFGPARSMPQYRRQSFREQAARMRCRGLGDLLRRQGCRTGRRSPPPGSRPGRPPGSGSNCGCFSASRTARPRASVVAGAFVEAGAEAREHLQFFELRIEQPQIAGDGAIGRKLRFAADARHGFADIDRRQNALLKQVRASDRSGRR